jgi:hypothetical protein
MVRVQVCLKPASDLNTQPEVRTTGNQFATSSVFAEAGKIVQRF